MASEDHKATYINKWTTHYKKEIKNLQNKKQCEPEGNEASRKKYTQTDCN
jgi:hypothetical protein